MKQPLLLLPFALCMSGCNSGPAQPAADQTASQAGAPAVNADALARINQAAPPPKGQGAPAPAPSGANAAAVPPDPFVIRAEALLARARFSPGVVDGKEGTNFKHAIAAYQDARGIDATGTLDDRTWQALQAEAQSSQPVARGYTITAADIAGPFAPDVGEDFVKLAALPNGPQFTNVVEALAERFHMSQELLRALNPGVDFSKAGQGIVVVDDGAPGFAKGDVKRVEVIKSDASVRAYDAQDRLIAFYPATVGSTERPSPTGLHKVVGVAPSATYTYDPAKLKWGPRHAGKLIIKPGPNNPVGEVWIDLNAPSYGLHGTPDPDNIGKTASHGCVRLTNWDAKALAAGVQPGVEVKFIGQRGG